MVRLWLLMRDEAHKLWRLMLGVGLTWAMTLAASLTLTVVCAGDSWCVAWQRWCRPGSSAPFCLPFSGPHGLHLSRPSAHPCILSPFPLFCLRSTGGHGFDRVVAFFSSLVFCVLALALAITGALMSR